jgi:hypothetical protein
MVAIDKQGDRSPQDLWFSLTLSLILEITHPKNSS